MNSTSQLLLPPTPRRLELAPAAANPQPCPAKSSALREGRFFSPAGLTERSERITSTLREILNRVEPVPHGGLNE